jgi:hypothetical protein
VVGVDSRLGPDYAAGQAQCETSLRERSLLAAGASTHGAARRRVGRVTVVSAAHPGLYVAVAGSVRVPVAATSFALVGSVAALELGPDSPRRARSA